MNQGKPLHVFCAREFTPAQLARLQSVSPRLVIRQAAAPNRSELTRLAPPETEILFSSLSPESLAGLPRLRWMQTRGAGVNALAGSPVWSGDVLITSASGLHAIPIGEYVLGMMVALARDFLGFLEHQRRACWPMKPKIHVDQFPGRELRGATVLILGYGSIGREVARLCHTLGLRIIAIKRDPSDRVDRGYIIPGTGDPAGTIPEQVLAPDRIDEVLPEAEYVVVAAAATRDTHHLIGEAQLRRMRPDAFLINVARGEVVDEAALIRALRERWIAGAGLDVFEHEPLSADSPLWSLDNVILSPHVAGITPRYDDHVVEIFAENLRRYLAGKPLLNVVDRARGY
jgi:phosphoglycerate dehydrogenase-like enzyme